MKKAIKISITIVAIVLCGLMFSFKGIAQTQFTMSIASVSATANTMDVTLTVTATNPSPGIRFGGFSAGINFNTAIINGGTISASYLGGRSASLSSLPANAINVATAGHIRLPTVSLSGAQGVDVPQGTSLTLGTYRISNTANWTTSSNANLWLQPTTGTGKTNSVVLGYPYGLTTPAVSYTTTNPVIPAGLILSHTSTSTFSALLNAASGPTASVLSGSATICAGASTNLSVAVTGGTSPYTVTVTDGINNYSATGASPVSIAVSPTSTSNYSIVSVTGGGTGTGNSGSATVTVTPLTTTGSESQSVCGASYTWPTSGATYTASGSYTHVVGCNTATLTLTLTAQPAQPTLACYQAATFNTATCSWDVTGTQPVEPTTTLACYQTRLFNTGSCTWVTSGTQPAEPTTTLACYQTRTFNGAVGVCAWEVSGTQPAEPTTALACYQTRTFNGAVGVCAWEVSGTQPAQPTTACYQTATFNGCTWDLTGTQQTNTIPVTAVGTYTWANNGQTYSASGTYTGNVVNCVIQVLNLTITPVQSGVLSLKVYLEGYYLSGGQMRSALANSGVGTNNAISDTIKVQLRSQSSPNASVLSANVLLSTNGTASISIPPSLIGGNYYIAVYHRNSLETWSSSAIAITGNTSFDFTTSSSQAYGTASMKQVEAGVWALYSGDHNQDGAITPSDLGSVATEASLFSFGYIKTDLTGDGAIDGFDLGLADNNSQALLVSSHP